MNKEDYPELYRKYRPTEFDQVVGNDAVLKTLTDWIAKGNVPHAILLSGQSGNGKTTIGRILAAKMGCKGSDFVEINAANFRGIDTIRDIQTASQMNPVGGKCRVWLLDECFHSSTKIETSTGFRTIDSIQKGDFVRGLDGWKKVEEIFQNVVSLDRLVRVSLSDGGEIYCSEDHEFYTSRGWEFAKNLTGCCILSDSGYTSQISKFVEDVSNGDFDSRNVSLVQEEFYENNESGEGRVLREVLRQSAEESKTRIRQNQNGAVQGVWQGNDLYDFSSEGVLLYDVCGSEQNEASGNSRRSPLQGNRREDSQRPSEIFQYGEGRGTETTSVRTNETSESLSDGRCNGKSNGDQEKKGNSQHFYWGTRRKRENHRTPTNPSRHASGKLGDGVGDSNFKEKSVPDLLQSGFGQSEAEDGCRSGRSWAQIEREYHTRCEEDGTTSITWVEGVEVYKRGSNEGRFAGVVGDSERVTGTIILYDLQVEGHPSYFAEGVPVHNCHMMTRDSQSAALKLLEDPPRKSYFMLATTDPAKLLPTVKTRCSEIKVTPLSDKLLGKLLTDVAKKENSFIKEAVVDRICTVANGSARKALVILQQVIDIADEAGQLDAVLKSESAAASIDLAKALMFGKPTWAALGTLLGKVEDDPESVRRLILAYCSKIMITTPAQAAKAAAICNAFRDPTYDLGVPGLRMFTRDAYEALGGK